MIDQEQLLGAQVQLSDPEGNVYRFRVCALVPQDGELFAVLEHDENHQWLIAQVETGADDAPVFSVTDDQELIDTILERLAARAVVTAMGESDDL